MLHQSRTKHIYWVQRSKIKSIYKLCHSKINTWTFPQVVAAEGEQHASRALKEAADIMAQSPAAIQLRYLQTLNSIAAERNSTIIFPLPMDLLRGFMKWINSWRCVFVHEAALGYKAFLSTENYLIFLL